MDNGFSCETICIRTFIWISKERSNLRKLLLLLLLIAPIVQGANTSFIFGMVLNATDANSFYINISSSNITDVIGIIQVISAKPQNELVNFIGKDLLFNVVGHDIQGRLVVDGYYYKEQNQNLSNVKLIGGTYIVILGNDAGGNENTIVPISDEPNEPDEPDEPDLPIIEPPEDLIPGKGNAYGLIKHKQD